MKILRLLEMLSVEKGWINVKIDNNLKERIKKYVKQLDIGIPEYEKYDLRTKLVRLLTIKDNNNLQDVITYMIILQYFKEIKDNFDGPAGGLLMEEILSCLVYGERILGNKKEDFIGRRKFYTKNLKSVSSDKEIIGDNGEILPLKPIEKENISYQVKFYTRGNFIKIDMNKLCDITIVCIRDDRSKESKIHICFLNERDIINNSTATGISTAQLVRDLDKKNVVLDFKEINNTLNKIGDDIKKGITDIYDNLARLHDAIDDVMIGDKNKVIEADFIADEIKKDIKKIIK
jgi:hypothetical protein